MPGQSLETYLTEVQCGRLADGDHQLQLGHIIARLAETAKKISEMIAFGVLRDNFADALETSNVDGDVQKNLDVVADEMFLESLRETDVAVYGSEETEDALLLDESKSFVLAIDPLDGSSNIETNISIGTIFSILPVKEDVAEHPESSLLQKGEEQVAAGYFIYGPQLSLVLTLGSGTKIFVFSPEEQAFIEAYDKVSIPAVATEYAINASNYRNWDDQVRLYIDDCFAGKGGPREKNFNMRWVASLVAECYRIMVRGGVFLYPGDKRPGYAKGRLRLVYEANPIAFLVEQADGQAIDGVNRILELEPSTLHQRTPLVFGSSHEVGRIRDYISDPNMISARSPLFGSRGLFRA